MTRWTVVEIRQRRSLTVLDLTRQYYIELLANVWIEQAVEIEPIRSLLPTGQVRDLVPVQYVAFRPQLTSFADLGVNRGQKQPVVDHHTIGDIPRTVIPSQTDTGPKHCPFASGALGCALRW